MFVILIILNSIIVNTHEIYLGFDIYESTRKFSLVMQRDFWQGSIFEDINQIFTGYQLRVFVHDK